ncbi:MAG TPA: cellulase family glycosylhydrolase [Verrucomicrobiae bacterium]|nr:cellulase family glycosylhydrolase [Verrucomicrobiae bacterium]
MRIHWWLLLACLPLLSPAQEIPEPVIPNGVGVNIHFATGHEQDLDLIAAAGFRFVRMDFGWASIERLKGQYDWSEYEQLLRNLDQRGIRAVLILDYSNPLYEEEVTSTNPLTHQSHRTTASPQHPESIAAYAKWAAAAASHFHGRHVLWELWNEPNIDFWSPKPDVHQYTALALAACKTIREADPGATIIGPATSGFPWEFLEYFLKSGVLEHLDAVSVHPYREPRRSPETAAKDYERLRELIERYAPATKAHQIPILSGEWGYSSWQRGVSMETQASFLARQQLSNLLNGVPLSIWYDWKNDGTDPGENEHNFGTVTSQLEPKPAYAAARTLTHELAGYRVARRQNIGSDQDYVLICTNGMGAQKLVGWTIGEPHTVAVPVAGNATSVSLIGGSGEPQTTKLESGRCILRLGASPEYLTLHSSR